MAIVAQIVVQSRRYSGWEDPRYPIGYWWAALELEGDATGGAFAIDLLFQPAFPAFLNSQMYSVERFGITSPGATNRVVEVRTVNMSGPSNAPFSQAYAVRLESLTNLVGASLRPESLAILPWFLGSQRQAGTSASLSLRTANDATLSITFEAEGYRWSARSVLADGGPQRPPTGPYRR